MSPQEAKLMETVGCAGSGNMLVHGDCVASCAFVSEQIEAGEAPPIDLVYIDPPFASGCVYGMRAILRPHPTDVRELSEARELPHILVPAFDDSWELDAWLAWMRDNLLAIKQIMSPHASIYVHLDHHSSAYMRVLLDELFGREAFRSEIIWPRPNPVFVGTSFKDAHETILHYALSPDSIFNVADPPIGDVWADIGDIYGVNIEEGGYATQKPEKLLERIITASSDEGMLVADFFGGSGVCAAVAAKLGRKFIHADASIRSVQFARQRLREIEGLSFDVFGLGDADSTRDCEGNEALFEVEQLERAGHLTWCTTIAGCRFKALEAAILDDNLRRHAARLFAGEEAPEPLRVSDDGLELIECVSLDCSSDEGTWHADVELFIDCFGRVVKDGIPTWQRWDGRVHSDLPPKRVLVRSIRGDVVAAHPVLRS